MSDSGALAAPLVVAEGVGRTDDVIFDVDHIIGMGEAVGQHLVGVGVAAEAFRVEMRPAFGEIDGLDQGANLVMSRLHVGQDEVLADSLAVAESFEDTPRILRSLVVTHRDHLAIGHLVARGRFTAPPRFIRGPQTRHRLASIASA